MSPFLHFCLCFWVFLNLVFFSAAVCECLCVSVCLTRHATPAMEENTVKEHKGPKARKIDSVSNRFLGELWFLAPSSLHRPGSCVSQSVSQSISQSVSLSVSLYVCLSLSLSPSCLSVSPSLHGKNMHSITTCRTENQHSTLMEFCRTGSNFYITFLLRIV